MKPIASAAAPRAHRSLTRNAAKHHKRTHSHKAHSLCPLFIDRQKKKENNKKKTDANAK